MVAILKVKCCFFFSTLWCYKVIFMNWYSHKGNCLQKHFWQLLFNFFFYNEWGSMYEIMVYTDKISTHLFLLNNNYNSWIQIEQIKFKQKFVFLALLLYKNPKIILVICKLYVKIPKHWLYSLVITNFFFTTNLLPKVFFTFFL